MSKFKLGFTVVEIMTAITVIGVAAAMVIPMSVKGLQKHQSVLVLGRVVEQITLGNQNLIQFANSNSENGSYTDILSTITVSDIDTASFGNNTKILDYDNFCQYIKPFWDLVPDGDKSTPSPSIKFFDGNVANDALTAAINNEENDKYKFSKLPAGVFINRATPVNSIIIDTTGWYNPPNVYGKDIFAFALNDDGTLRPFGVSDGNGGLELAERVVKDGFRINYY